MTKSKRFQPIAELAEQDQQAAAKTMRTSEQTLKAYTMRLEELETYREQYLQRFVSEGTGGVQAHQLKDYRVFLANLELAIDQMKEQINSARARHRQDTDDWCSRHRRSRALDKALTRFAGEERARAEQAAQRQLDECAQRAASGDAQSSDDES